MAEEKAASSSTTNRAAQIKAREAAIKRKFDAANSKNKATAQKAALKDATKSKGKTVTKSYKTEGILGANKGYTKSDYGIGAGAAIPYTTGVSTNKTSVTLKKPKAKPKPKPKPKSTGGHTTYKVKRGDTLSGIAKKHGTNWKNIWNYNLKNRSKKTQATLRKRGPHLIFRGGTFYIPKK